MGHLPALCKHGAKDMYNWRLVHGLVCSTEKSCKDDIMVNIVLYKNLILGGY